MTSAPRLPMPQLLLLAMIAIWGGSYVAVKDSLSYLQPFAVIAGRFWLAVLCLLPFLPWSALRGDLRRTAGTGLATGLVLALGYGLQTIGMNETSASMGGFLAGLIVLLVAVGGFLFLGAPLRAGAIVGLLLGLGGLVLLCLPQAGTVRGQRDTPFGILMQLGSTVAYAAHILMISRLSPRGAELAYCMWQLVVVAVAGTAAMVVQGGGIAVPGGLPFDGTLLLDVVYLGALATALGIAVQSRVQPRIPPTQIALLFATQPGFAAAAGWLLRGERLGVAQWLGGGLVVCGIVAASLRPRRPSVAVGRGGDPASG